MGENPVVVTPLGEIAQICEKLVPTLESLPHQLKDAAWSVWMSHEVVRLAEYLTLVEVRYLEKHLIHVNDTARRVGFAHD
jgi:hypothetical protein